MGSENEPAKLLLPYLQRADELQKHEPLVAYYCRLYAMERGMKIPSKERTKTTNALLVSLMNQLEKDKKSLKLVPEDSLYVEGFALNVFAKADKQDRASRADVNTAKTFYAASIFFEILNQFGELQPDLEQKQKYAAWKAVDIRKALKEGSRPEPGPPGGDKDLSLPASTPSNAYDLGSSETIPDNHPGLGADASPRFHDDDDHQLPTNTPASHPLPTSDYRSIDSNVPPSVNRPENSSFHQPYHHQPYTHETQPSVPQNYASHETQPPVPQNYPSHETQPPVPQNYPSHDTQPPMPQNYPSHDNQPAMPNYPSHETSSPAYSYPNFQSYPSFNDSNLPTLPSHYPSHYQGLDASYTHQSTPVTNYPSSAQYTPFSSNGTHSEPAPTSAPTFQYDSNYEPPPDKIAEAHKAARFAVGALAFDDVPVAVDFLIKSLELLTKPSASQ